MEIVVKQEGTPTVIAVEGKLDAVTSPQLDEFSSNLYNRGAHDIVVDMSQCPFVSSAGLRVIVAMQKRAAAKGSLSFRGVTAEVMDVFEITGFDKFLTIE